MMVCLRQHKLQLGKSASKILCLNGLRILKQVILYDNCSQPTLCAFDIKPLFGKTHVFQETLN
jgi:hypothetical protein